MVGPVWCPVCVTMQKAYLVRYCSSNVVCTRYWREFWERVNAYVQVDVKSTTDVHRELLYHVLDGVQMLKAIFFENPISTAHNQGLRVILLLSVDSLNSYNTFHNGWKPSLWV